MNTAAPCQETLILFHLESFVTQAATGFLNCCQFAIVAKALFGLFLVLKSDLFLLIWVLFNVFTNIGSISWTFPIKYVDF